MWNSGSVSDHERGFGRALWALRAGLKLGLVGVSDDHHTDQPPLLMGTGLTGCPADSLTRANILAALRARRCWATSGERITMDLSTKGVGMGGEVTATIGESVPVTFEARWASAPIRLEILRNGDVAAETECAGPGCVFSAPVEIVEERRRLRTRAAAERKGRWSSPVWVRGACARRQDCPVQRLAPGGGPAASDCLAEWKAAAPIARRSLPTLSCRDGDPRCDAGTTPSECTMRVGICFGMDDRRVRTCEPAMVDDWQLLEPADQGSVDRDDPDFQNRAVLLAAVRALGDSPRLGTCTAVVDLRVPVPPAQRGARPQAGPRQLRAVAHAGAAVDEDRLRLRCLPARR